MSEEKEVFQYTYSASQQEEIKKIREKNCSNKPEEPKMEQLRRLDQSAEKPGMVFSIALGVISCLIFGVGISCITVWENLMIPGVIIGIVGMAGIIAAYPSYVTITKKQRKKLTPEILRLTDELMK